MANDGTVKIGVDVEEKEFKSGLSRLGSIAKSGLGATTAAIGAATAAATAGTVALGKLAQSAVSAYSDYEQLVGGVETLFKECFCVPTPEPGWGMGPIPRSPVPPGASL